MRFSFPPYGKREGRQKVVRVGATTRSRMQIDGGCFQQNSTISASASAVMKSGLPSRVRYSSKLICMPLWDVRPDIARGDVDDPDAVHPFRLAQRLAEGA